MTELLLRNDVEEWNGEFELPCMERNMSEQERNCRLLWYCVIERAFSDCFLESDEVREDLLDPWKWIMSKDLAFNSFEHLCSLLDLDSESIRKKLIEKKRAGNFKKRHQPMHRS